MPSDYVTRLLDEGMLPSMSRPGNPYDNAMCESFMKTLKQEEIYCNDYANLEQLRASIDEFIGVYYNRRRLHSALGYRTPERVEADVSAGAPELRQTAALLSFWRHKEIFRSDSSAWLRAGRERSCPDASCR